VISYYPLSETPHIGQIHLVDVSVGRSAQNAESYQQFSVLLTDELVAGFEAQRTRHLSAARFPQSPEHLATQLHGTGTGQATGYGQAPGTATEHPWALAAFPSMTLASIDQGAVAGTVPQAFANFMAYIGLRETRYLHIEADGVETAEIPFDTTLSVIRAGC